MGRNGTARTLALVALALAAGMGAGVGLEPGVSAQPPSDFVHYRRLDLETPWGQRRVLVTLPRRADRGMHPNGRRYPILIALHGRGEALIGPDRGYLAFAVRYMMPDAFEALRDSRLTQTDYRGLVRGPHLRQVNAQLRERPFGGMMVVTPYVPDLGGEELGAWDMTEYVDWLAGPLVDAVRERFPGAAARTREGVGIDGISLGGRGGPRGRLSTPPRSSARSGASSRRSGASSRGSPIWRTPPSSASTFAC